MAAFLTAIPAHAAQDAVVLKPSVTEGTHKRKPSSHNKKPPRTEAKKTDPGDETASKDGSKKASSSHAIVALVNDEPITGFEIERRAMMLSGSAVGATAKANFEALVKSPKTTERIKAILNQVVQANQGKSRDEIIAIFEARKKEFGLSLQKQAMESARASALPAMKKQALDELIDEKLKLQEAKKQSVTIGEDEIKKVISGIAARNKMSEAEFEKQIGGSMDPMKDRIRAVLSWNEVVRRKFGPMISVTSRDVDKLVAESTAETKDAVELHLQRIQIAMPMKLDEAEVAKRIEEAEKIRTQFSDCKSTGKIITGVPGAHLDEVGNRRPSTFPEPTRTLLLNASDGEMLPPSIGEGGIELWAVCGRDVVKADEEKRNVAEGELKQKEFELMAKRYLKDLRDDAHIEYR